MFFSLKIAHLNAVFVLEIDIVVFAYYCAYGKILDVEFQI